jgi:hypothetical protein
VRFPFASAELVKFVRSVSAVELSIAGLVLVNTSTIPTGEGLNRATTNISSINLSINLAISGSFETTLTMREE